MSCGTNANYTDYTNDFFMEQVSERAMRIAEEIVKRTSTGHYRLVLNENREPSITGSKVGGLPYWPAGKDFPVDEQGKKMLMLMQLNCEEAGLASPLPDHGLIQWFISVNPERMYGCMGNYDEAGAGFRIVYHEEIGENATPADVPTHDNVEDMVTPVKRETAIDVVKEEISMGVTDGHFNRLFFDIVKEITGAEPTAKMWYEYLDNDDCLYFEKHLGMKRPRHQMLGYPFFTQDDARRDMDSQNTLLFQLDSQFSTIDNKELVMWGDMGSGFIFIDSEALVARNFSLAYYCWDCG